MSDAAPTYVIITSDGGELAGHHDLETALDAARQVRCEERIVTKITCGAETVLEGIDLEARLADEAD